MQNSLNQNLLRRLLQESLVQRQMRNPSYSIRAFSQALGINHSALSEIFNGKRKVGPKLARRLAQSLMLGTDAQDKLFEVRSKKAENERTAERLKADQFKLISDWYHFAILSLAEIKKFQSEPAWISERLGISRTQARDALDRLQRLGLLRGKNGRLTPTGSSYDSPDGMADLAIQKTHAQYLDLAHRALELQDCDVRDFTGMTMAIDPKKLPEAKRRIRAFRHDLCEFLESGEKQQVYQFCIQLFSLSDFKKGETK
jgi:uncharacterized protein (TIGR02147 family)